MPSPSDSTAAPYAAQSSESRVGDRLVGVLAVLSGLLAALATAPPAILNDDVFITLRYAENLASGRGFVYNVGESYLGLTSPIYGIALAGLCVLTGASAVVVAFWGHVAAIAGLSWATVALLRGSALRPVGVFAPWVVLSFPNVSLTAGMESLLFMAWGLACIAWWVSARCRSTRLIALGLACGVLCLIRPDGVFLAAILFVATWIRARRFPLGAVIAGALPIGGWAIASQSIYGTVLPATVGAKAAQSGAALWPIGFFDGLWNGVVHPHAAWLAGIAAWGVVCGIVARNAAVAVVVAWFVLHNAAYALSGVPPYSWYYVPMLVQLTCLAAFGVSRMPWMVLVARSRPSVIVGSAAIGVAVLAVVNRPAIWTSIERGIEGDVDPRSAPYYRIGRWLDRHALPRERVAATEIGIVGYYCRRHLVDFIGLVTPGVAPRLRDHAHIDAAMKRYRPDYLVVAAEPTGHQADLLQYIVRSYDAVFSCLPYLVLKRKGTTEVTLAERAVAALDPALRDLSFGDFPRLLDFEAFREAMRDRRPDLTIHRWPHPDAPVALRLNRRHRVSVVPAWPPAAHYTGHDLAQWTTHEGYTIAEGSLRARWRVLSPFGFISRGLRVRGPIRRVRLRLRVEPTDAERCAGVGRLWWEATQDTGGPSGEHPSGYTTFFIPRTNESVLIAIDFHAGGPSARQILTLLRLDLFDAPAVVEVQDLWLDRG